MDVTWRSRRRDIAVLISVALVSCSGDSHAGGAAASAAPNPTAVSGVTASAAFVGTYYPSQGHTHLQPDEPDDFVYSSNPPTSGPHREIFNDSFISPVPLAKYVQVHLLEHGNVLLQYSCSCPDVESALGAIAMQYDKHVLPAGQLQPTAADVQNAEEQGFAVIVAPYPHMKSKIALTAWTRLGVLDSVDKHKVTSFIDTYLHNGVNASQ